MPFPDAVWSGVYIFCVGGRSNRVGVASCTPIDDLHLFASGMHVLQIVASHSPDNCCVVMSRFPA